MNNIEHGSVLKRVQTMQIFVKFVRSLNRSTRDAETKSLKMWLKKNANNKKNYLTSTSIEMQLNPHSDMVCAYSMFKVQCKERT